ncbi:LOW QUALITY PROTEIN: centrosomal protein CCDC61-like [Morphnus guianensis]
MGKPWYLQADCAFWHGGHTIQLTLTRSAVEAHLTADQWREEFDAAFIEDLTHKMGNFKQFGIFCSMLESVLMQSSKSISLKLLTYADLETLRSRKAGAIAQPLPPSATSPLSAKRYLILIYSVQFDRIRYPLPLPYAGRPDPAELRKLLWELREELVQLQAQHGEDRQDAEIQCLWDELQRVLEEKRAAEAVLQRELDGGQRRQQRCSERHRLEDELLREKAWHQREHRQLTTELAEAKALEWRLQLRVKSLMAELASCKRGCRTPVGTAPLSQEQRSPLGTWPPCSTSRESRGGSQGRPPAWSPSPAGPHPARFNPTAFVRARQRRQKVTKLKNQRCRAAFGSANLVRSCGRSSSAKSFRSWCLVVSSSSEADECSEPLPPRGRRVTCTQRPLSTSSCNSPGTNCYKEPSAKLAKIDAQLQKYTDSLDTHT